MDVAIDIGVRRDLLTERRMRTLLGWLTSLTLAFTLLGCHGQAGADADAGADGFYDAGAVGANDCGDDGRNIVIKSGSLPGSEPPPAGACDESIDWTSDGGAPGADAWSPPTEETHECPPAHVRIHVRDLWSTHADPTLGVMSERPLAVAIVDEAYNDHAAKPESVGCDWYAACVPTVHLASFQLRPIGSNACPSPDMSGHFDMSAWGGVEELWVDYIGNNLAADYTSYPNVPIGPQSFRLSTDAAEVASIACPPGKPEVGVPEGYTKLHLRWFWGDPDLTGFAGTSCESALGFETPPYPTSLKVELEGCNDAVALLEFENGHCPWYYVLIPNEQWKGNITVRYPDHDVPLFTPSVPLPQPRVSDEYWMAYAGAPDDEAMFGTGCMNWSQRANVYHFYASNPGPGYGYCGGGASVVVDPCNPPVPDGYSTVHFRYLWAGQKTFTYFPSPALMPHWMVLEVNGGGGDKDIICFREADRPWFNCPVPNGEFRAGATWRAVDKTHAPEWNTVQARPFADAPGEYWLRWYYGKPDIPSTSRFKFFDYDPDGTNGDWSATGQWNDDACAPRPAPSPVNVGFGGWFPYDETDFAYPFGASLARTYAKSNDVQELLNALVFERYQLWKDNYVVSDDAACGTGTARIKTDPPETVSEGQGYGIAMAAAIGDKDLFEKLWRFTRHHLSQSAKKYCGGLMGWMWDGATACRALDEPCDPDTEGCGGNGDSAFDGDVDIGIGLLFAARQWPEYDQAAVDWILKMECEVNTAYDGTWHYPTPGDTWDKSCDKYPSQPCYFKPGYEGTVNLSYYPPGYFRAFGDYVASQLPGAEGQGHRAFWYKTAETVYEMLERCYDAPGVHPALVTDWGHYATPCDSQSDNYNWSRALWRIGVDAAWYGNRTNLAENLPGASSHYGSKSRMQAKIDNVQGFYAGFFQNNPPELHANRFSTICQNLDPSGTVSGCDPAVGHNSYFVNTALTAFVSVFDNGGSTTPDIRREALEESVSTAILNDRYYQESIGVYTLLFLSGNFPNPMDVP